MKKEVFCHVHTICNTVAHIDDVTQQVPDAYAHEFDEVHTFPITPLLFRVSSCQLSININHMFNVPQDMFSNTLKNLRFSREYSKKASNRSSPTLPKTTPRCCSPFVGSCWFLPCWPLPFVNFQKRQHLGHRQIDIFIVRDRFVDHRPSQYRLEQLFSYLVTSQLFCSAAHAYLKLSGASVVTRPRSG